MQHRAYTVWWYMVLLCIRCTYCICATISLQVVEGHFPPGMAPSHRPTTLLITLLLWTARGLYGWVTCMVMTVGIECGKRRNSESFPCNLPSPHSIILYQAPLPGYLISMTIVTMDIQDSSSSDSCEKDWLDIGGVRWVMKLNCVATEVLICKGQG